MICAPQAAPGDSLLVDTKAGYAFERIPKAGSVI
jgi:hypothetical protein